MGFAVVENVTYYGGALHRGGAPMLGLAVIMRGVLSPWLHPIYTIMTGLGVGIARETTSPWLRKAAPYLGFTLACLLHMFWNSTNELLPTRANPAELLPVLLLVWLAIQAITGGTLFYSFDGKPAFFASTCKRNRNSAR